MTFASVEEFLSRDVSAFVTVVGYTLSQPGAGWYVSSVVLLIAGACVVWRAAGWPSKAAALILIALPGVGLAILSDVGPALAAVAVMSAAALLAGCAVLVVLSERDMNMTEATTVAFALGTGVLAASAFMLGAFNALTSGFVLIAVLAAVLIASFVTLRNRHRALMRPTVGQVLSRFDWLLMCLVLGLGHVVVPYVVAPEIMYDAVSSHLVIARNFATQGGLPLLPVALFSGGPVLPEIMYAIPITLSSIDAAKLVHFTIGIATALTVFAIGRRLAGMTGGLASAVLWLAMPLVLWEMSTGYTDLFLCLYCAAALLTTLVWSDSRRMAHASVAGALVGLGFGVKMTMALLALPLLGAAVVVFVRSRRDVAQLAVASCICALVALPWYARSYLLTGNPVFPFLNDIFQSTSAPRDSGAESLGTFGIGKGLIDFLSLPWTLTTRADQFGEVSAWAFNAVPLIVGLALCWAAGARSRKPAFALVFFLASVSLWFVTAQYVRYLLPTVVAGVALGGALVRVLAARHRVGAALSIGLLVVLAFSAPPLLARMMWNVPNHAPWAVALGSQSRDAYVRAALHQASTYQWMRTHLPSASNARVLGLSYSEWSAAYAPSEMFLGHKTIEGLRVLGARTPEDARAALDEGGFDYVLIDYLPRGAPWQMAYIVMTDEFIDRSMDLIYANNYVYLYRVVAAPDAMPSRREVLAQKSFETSQLGDAWRTFGRGAGTVAAASCSGGVVGADYGYIAEFQPAPDGLYTFSARMRAMDAGGFGKLQVNWLTADGAIIPNIEVYPLTAGPAEYRMSSTSPLSVVGALVYVSAPAFESKQVCIESLEVLAHGAAARVSR